MEPEQQPRRNRRLRGAAIVLALLALLGIAVQQTLGARGVSKTSPSAISVCIDSEGCDPAEGDPPPDGSGTPPPAPDYGSGGSNGGNGYSGGGYSGGHGNGGGSGGGGTNPPAPPPPPPPSPQPPPPPPPPAPPPPPPPAPPPPPPPSGGIVRNDKGNALIVLGNARPNQTATSCVTITYWGKPKARVRLYGTRSGNGLDQYVRLTITRGTSTATAPKSCAGFKADTKNYLGSGSGVVFDGLFADFPQTWDDAGYDPAGVSPAETWTRGEARAYRFRVQVLDDQDAMGLWLSQEFTWEARSID